MDEKAVATRSATQEVLELLRNNTTVSMEKDQKFVEMIVKEIVANPNDVKVDRTVDERGVLLTLNVNSGDIGYVIGKQGQTARAIRTLAKIVGAKNNARVNLKINEPEGSRGPRPRRDQVDTDVVDDLTI
ncbi:MAG: KH domain-containing protein [Patescibacteria group bacterium]